MTDVLFLHGVQNRYQAAAAWLAEATLSQRKVGVLLPDSSELERFDRLLWTQNSTGFLPHCHTDSPLAEQAPIVLGCEADKILHDDCLLNLSNQVPKDFSRFRQLIEVISTQGSDKDSGRERFRHYRELGYALDSQDYAEGSRA